MGAIEEGGKVAITTVETLGKSPLALGLIVINLIFLLGGGYVIRDVAERTGEANERRDKMLSDIIRSCKSFEMREGAK